MQPLEPANPSAFGPTGPRSTAPLRNPLPPPPRDIYEMSPYKSLLTMPQTSALLTASYGPHLATVSTNVQPAKVERKRSIGKSLLRAFSKREKKPDPQPQVHFVPVFVPSADQNHSQNSSHPVVQTYPTETAQQAADLIRSMSQQSHVLPARTPMHATAPVPPSAMRHNTPGPTSVAASTHSADAMFPPVPPNPSSPPAVRFDQDSPYAVFMNHSPHRVVYRSITYPTAAHLFEAMKFIDNHPDIAENIRACPDVNALYSLASQYTSSVRPDWVYTHLQYMDDVLLLKFRQHADLRMKLLGTGDARIIYADPNDAFWGSGSDETGQNLLGKALVTVREKLRMENLSMGT
ncbi:hypothetical protein HYPSUDRAFT_196051 [Hypholoma sublateritium FD-334 SS-4]|uniref:NADAR domain-containing protein n=1 Tax=Hypholoma sublateritium (strain FD-334 SS-4) TaxID=945553 RepID=A0A0D2PG31_HYPSF|nr:hypothetical protein HYPSUDRAFT_196051 [Hypholoma sublateritium FD-334 SS-4]